MIVLLHDGTIVCVQSPLLRVPCVRAIALRGAVRCLPIRSLGTVRSLRSGIRSRAGLGRRIPRVRLRRVVASRGDRCHRWHHALLLDSLWQRKARGERQVTHHHGLYDTRITHIWGPHRAGRGAFGRRGASDQARSLLPRLVLGVHPVHLAQIRNMVLDKILGIGKWAAAAG